MESSHAQHLMRTFGRALRNIVIHLMSDSQRDSRFIELKLLSPSDANLYLVLLEKYSSSNFRQDALDAEFTQYFRSTQGQQRAKRFLDLVPSRVGSLSGAMCCDTSQNPSHRARAGAWVPALTRSSCMALLTSASPFGHFFTPNELASSQGWPRILGSNKRYTEAMGVDMTPLSMNAQ